MVYRIRPNISSVDTMAANPHQNGSTQYKEPSHKADLRISSRKGLEIHCSLVSYQTAAAEEKRWCEFSTNIFTFNPCFRSRLVVKLASNKGNFFTK